MIIDYIWNYIVINIINDWVSLFFLLFEVDEMKREWVSGTATEQELKKKWKRRGRRQKRTANTIARSTSEFNWTRNKITINKTYAEDANPFAVVLLLLLLQPTTESEKNLAFFYFFWIFFLFSKISSVLPFVCNYLIYVVCMSEWVSVSVLCSILTRACMGLKPMV